MPSNHAAQLPPKLARSLAVSEVPYPTPSKGQIVIRNAAVAINPIDWLIQSRGDLVFPWLKYSSTLGFDAAGEVVEVGEEVTRFKVGDRVLGLCRGIEKDENDPSQGAFQHYTVLRENWVSHIRAPGMSFIQGATLPLGVAAASAALFDSSYLGLDLPTVPARPSTGKTILVWGGSSSVGCCAIQLAVAAGYEVFTTASPKNHDLVRRLGASRVWDYNSSSVVDEIAEGLKGKVVAGAVAIGSGSGNKCMCVLEKAPKGANKFVAMATLPMPDSEPTRMGMVSSAASYLTKTATYGARSMVNGIKWNYVSMDGMAGAGLNKQIFVDFLPEALESGSFVPSPEPLIVGHGLETIQEAFELQKKGVSAQKIVVTL
uniref:Enoyl reductase (ER) domain-containing protein n=1 Tax=Bionectria ochroleuca TaxID=29856 RepID=A0A8H7KCF5_BIOOC